MKRNITGLLICLLFNIVVNDMFSQDKNNESLKKSEWIATNQIGFSTITAKNILKTNALIFEGFIGKEFSLSSKTSDRKSTRLNSSHVKISYAVFCLKKKKKNAN